MSTRIKHIPKFPYVIGNNNVTVYNSNEVGDVDNYSIFTTVNFIHVINK